MGPVRDIRGDAVSVIVGLRVGGGLGAFGTAELGTNRARIDCYLDLCTCSGLTMFHEGKFHNTLSQSPSPHGRDSKGQAPAEQDMITGTF